MEAAGGVLHPQQEPGTQLNFISHLGTSQEVSVLEEILCSRFAIISSAIELAGLQALVRCLHWLSSSNISTGQNTLVGVDCAPQCVRVSYGGQKWSFSEEACHPILTAMEQSFSYRCIIG